MVRPGDVVVIPSVNYAIIKPRRGLRFKLRTLRIDNPVPLRLICTDGAEGAFYTSALGFLPYSLSAGPLDEFTILEVLPG